MLISVIAALAVVIAVQAFAIVYLARAAGAVGRVSERVTRLSAALELLTDTAEAGFGSVAQEIERAGPTRRTAPAGSRRAVGKRISAAVRDGQSVEEIAAREALSESEVRLHLQLLPEAR